MNEIEKHILMRDSIVCARVNSLIVIDKKAELIYGWKFSELFST